MSRETPRERFMTVRLSTEEIAALERFAARRDVTRSEVVRWMVQAVAGLDGPPGEKNEGVASVSHASSNTLTATR